MFHLLAVAVLALEALGAAIGLLVGKALFDPRPLIGSDNQPFDPSRHPTTVGYAGEVVVASMAVLAIGLLLIPVLRRAGSPTPVVAALSLDAIVIAGVALWVIDGAIRDNQPGGCCAGPGLSRVWWQIWCVGAVVVGAASLISSACTLRRRGRAEP